MENMRPALEHICRRQTWSQSASILIYIRNWYVSLISKSRQQVDVGLCTTSALAKKMLTIIVNFKLKNFFGRKIGQNCQCAAAFSLPMLRLGTDLDPTLLYILILGTYRRFERGNDFLALGVSFPQPCSSAGRMFADSRSRLHYYPRIVSFPQKGIWWCLVNWIPLRIRDYSRNTQPYLKMRLGWKFFHDAHKEVMQ